MGLSHTNNQSALSSNIYSVCYLDEGSNLRYMDIMLILSHMMCPSDQLIR